MKIIIATLVVIGLSACNGNKHYEIYGEDVFMKKCAAYTLLHEQARSSYATQEQIIRNNFDARYIQGFATGLAFDKEIHIIDDIIDAIYAKCKVNPEMVLGAAVQKEILGD